MIVPASVVPTPFAVEMALASSACACAAGEVLAVIAPARLTFADAAVPAVRFRFAIAWAAAFIAALIWLWLPEPIAVTSCVSVLFAAVIAAVRAF